MLIVSIITSHHRKTEKTMLFCWVTSKTSDKMHGKQMPPYKGDAYDRPTIRYYRTIDLHSLLLEKIYYL